MPRKNNFGLTSKKNVIMIAIIIIIVIAAIVIWNSVSKFGATTSDPVLNDLIFDINRFNNNQKKQASIILNKIKLKEPLNNSLIPYYVLNPRFGFGTAKINPAMGYLDDKYDGSIYPKTKIPTPVPQFTMVIINNTPQSIYITSNYMPDTMNINYGNSFTIDKINNNVNNVNSVYGFKNNHYFKDTWPILMSSGNYYNNPPIIPGMNLIISPKNAFVINAFDNIFIDPDNLKFGNFSLSELVLARGSANITPAYGNTYKLTINKTKTGFILTKV